MTTYAPTAVGNTETLKMLFTLPQTLVLGSSIRIRGFVPQYAKRFSINLQGGPGDYTDDIMLQFDVRPEQNIVVRNHFKPSRQFIGPEETSGGMPFKQNTAFEVVFLMEQSGIRILVDDAPFAFFDHRLPFIKITHLRIHRDIDLNQVTFEKESLSDNIV